MLKLSANAHRELMETIVSLVRIVNFIRNSANVAYKATTKSFGYIAKILTLINQMQNIDRDRIRRCADVIQRKRKELTEIIKLD